MMRYPILPPLLLCLVFGFLMFQHGREVVPPANLSRDLSAVPSQTKTAAMKTTAAPLSPAMTAAAVAAPSPIADFTAWATRYELAGDAVRPQLLAEGLRLAEQREVALYSLIATDPEAALLSAVPERQRRLLPASIQPWLEQRIAARGELARVVARSAKGRPLARATWREVRLAGTTYEAFVYGRRAEKNTLYGASISGIALRGRMAVNDSPVSVLSRAELPLGAVLEPITRLGNHTANSPADQLATAEAQDRPIVVADGRYFPTCCSLHATTLASRWQKAEAQATGPTIPPSSGDAEDKVVALAVPPPVTASPHVLGNKTLLVIVADFADMPGRPVDESSASSESMTTAYLTTRITGEVAPWFSAVSYNQTTVTSPTVTNVLRLPSNLATYVTANNVNGLRNDALAAATTAGHTPANFDRVAVVFGNTDALTIAATFPWSGLADEGGSFSWYNGYFNNETVSHELTHNMGVNHANLWVIPPTSSNPLDSAGSSMEYGDLFDIMGFSTSNTATIPDHPNPWFLNMIGWLPDAAVQTITASGTYRVSRFDHPSANLASPLALRLARNETTNYWLGYRRKYAGDATLSDMANGAYVTWGYNTNKQGNLLDLDTPSTEADFESPDYTPQDASLNVGSTLADTASGISINVTAAGGTTPNEYLDIQITYAPRIAFSQPKFFIDERIGTAAITVNRLNDGTGAITVNYATVAGTATSGTDYTATSGTLSWIANDFTPRTILVPITADAIAEGGSTGTETFIVRLSGVTGAALPSGTDATVVIHDAGAADLSLTPPFLTSSASAVIVQPEDGKIIIGGHFSASKPLTVDGLARLTANGKHDPSFDQGAGPSPTPINAMQRQADGKILVIGDFTTLRGLARSRIARLNADGSPDASFNAGVGANDTLNVIALQPDGKILVGGDFTTWNGSSLAGLVRLEADGTLDASFTTFDTVVISPTVNAIALQPIATAPHFAILVGGLFQRSPSGSSFRSGIVRLTATGALDATFDALKGAHAAGASNSLRRVSAIATQQDGKILVGGQFTGFNGTNASRLARLNNDGTNDASFITAMGTGLTGGSFIDVTSFWPQPDGKIIVGGYFTTASGGATEGLARYTATGARDATFKSDLGVASGADSFAMQPDGGLVVGLNGFHPSAMQRVFTGSIVPSILSFTTATASGTEGGSIELTVQRTGGSTGAISVNYHTTPGTAAAGSDYTTSTGTLAWADGDSTSKTIAVPILTDATTEADEILTVQLGIPLGGTLLGATTSATLTILGGDTSAFPRANFATTTSSATEGSSSVTIDVTLTAAAGQPVSIPLNFAGTASRGSDYTSSVTALDFSATDTSKSFTLTVIDDTALDALLETAIITLGSPNGPALLGADTTHTFSITDNEAAAQITLPPASQTFALGSPMTLTVTASGVPAPTYKWKKNNVLIAGATASTFTITPSVLTTAGTYKVEVTNHGITQTSGNAEVAIADATVKNLAPLTGSTFTRTLSVAGNGLTYQWFKGSAALVNSTSPSTRITGVATKTLTIKTLALTDSTAPAETYFCRVISGLGAVDFTAVPTTLQVIDAVPVLTTPAVLPPTIVGGDYAVESEFITTDSVASHTPASYSATGLPTGLSIVPTTGQIIGRPTVAITVPTTYHATLKATNAKGTGTKAADIVVNPLPTGSIGTWAGYISRDATINAGHGGRFDLTILSNGSGSGKVQLGSTTTAIKCLLATTVGTTTPTTDFTVLHGTGKLPLRIQFTLDSTNNVLTSSATITTAAATANIHAWRNKFSAAAPANDFKGYYTFGLKRPLALDTEESIPQGHSYGSFTIAAAGTTSIVTVLADGTTITQAAFVGPNGELLIYAPLYGTTGSLVGALDITPGMTNPQNTLGGTLTWSRNPQTLATQRSYKAGFVPAAPSPALPFNAIDLTPVGGRYTDPATLVPVPIVMGLLDADQNAKLTFGEAITGLIPAPLPSIILTRLKVGGTLATPLATGNVNPRTVTLVVTAKTGAFSGTMIIKDQNPIAAMGTFITRLPNPAFKGFIVTDGSIQHGLGYFLLQKLPSMSVPATSTPFLSSPAVLEANP